MDTNLNATLPIFEGQALSLPCAPQPIQRSTAIEGNVAILDKHGVVSFSSPALGTLFNCSPNDLEGRHVASLIPGLPFKTVTPSFNLAFADFWGTTGDRLSFKGHLPSGERIPLAVSLKKLSIDNTSFILLGMLPSQEHTEHDGEFIRLIERTEAKAEVIMITDTSGIIQAVNSAFEKATGYSKEEVVGKPASLIKSGLHDPAFYEKMWESLRAGKEFQAVFVNRRKDGELFHEDKSIRPFIDASGTITHFVATSHSLSETLQTTLLRLHNEAYHDALTALPNRHLFEDRLKQAFSRSSRRGESFSLVYVDLDNFKTINDHYGHAVGDKVLHTAASRLRACIRDEDTVARLGGDEFAMILLDIHRREDVEIVLKKVLKSLNRGIRVEKKNLPIHASLGANIFPADGTDSKTLMMRADFAMYKAKSSGGNCFHFFSKDEYENADSKQRLDDLLYNWRQVKSANAPGTKLSVRR